MTANRTLLLAAIALVFRASSEVKADLSVSEAGRYSVFITGARNDKVEKFKSDIGELSSYVSTWQCPTGVLRAEYTDIPPIILVDLDVEQAADLVAKAMVMSMNGTTTRK